ncbi:DNA-directed RNA polymerase I subunit [Penicillium atrosanguineum]|uniref:DNA-directed RNA polymerase I subunit n=1 Tax=Penicillium atrosanguineum TaxID=1132637 RepID=UPI002399A79C|nr:DNA-directed RNA polymerase I subunit [Penicillium atrosanguineum]KAJ5298812.1 DNA-directed RNA polymerase I subunit [Penicillium atrosanguineum]
MSFGSSSDSFLNKWSKRNAWIMNFDRNDQSVRISYIDCGPPSASAPKGIILLIHGFPQSSYQFRHVINPLAEEGFRVIVPDYRGAGQSSHPAQDFRKSTMARDLFSLLHDHLGITQAIHLVGHDIGGMVAHAYVTQYPDHVASVIWGECPLPGTSVYDVNKRMPEQFHFVFHSVPDDLALSLRSPPFDLDFYALQYSQPGALRCSFEVYRAFEEDARENRESLRLKGKCTRPVLILSGSQSRHAQEAKEMVGEVYAGDIQIDVVKDSGHWIAEENPEGFVQAALAFIYKHASGQ